MAKFTTKYIENLGPKGKLYSKADPECRGLVIRVTKAGVKTWWYVYYFHGQRRWYRLGRFPDTGLADARKLRDKYASMVQEGIDPVEVKARIRYEHLTSPTIRELGQVFLNEWSKPRKKSWKEDERQLNTYIYPAWGKLKAKDITRQDIRYLLKEIAKRAPIQSNRLFALLRKMFGFAVMEDFLEDSPCDHIKPVGIERRRDRVLTEDEIVKFWSGLDTAGMSDDVRRILRLILVTAQRPGEVVGATWTEIDGDWWTISAERSKNNLAHRVYLSPLAKDLLGESEQGYIFPSPAEDKHIHPTALAKAIRRNHEHFGIDHFTPHDLRRTAASHMTANDVSRLTVSKILNHAEPGVTATYDRHSYDKEKRQAFEMWSRRLKSIIEGKEKEEDKVVPIR